MSLTSPQARVQYTLTGSGQTLTVPFKFINSTDLGVLSTVAGVDTTLSLGADYTVAGGGSEPATGTITLTAGTTGDVITISRNLNFTQPSVYTSNDAFPAKTTETALDRVTMAVQAIALRVARAIRFQLSSAETADITVQARKNKMLGFDANGDVALSDPVVAPVVSGSVIEISSYTALRNTSVSGLTTGRQARVSGYASSADGGGGLFTYNSGSSATDDNGTILQPTSGSGRWIRCYEGDVNVKWFGAKGDGSTDDTTAIQAALNKLAGKGTCFIPLGAYVVSSSLTIGTGGGVSRPVIIRGVGQGTQIINAAGGSTPTFAMKGVSFWVLRDMLLTGNSTAKNDMVLVDKDGSGNQSARFLIENVITQPAGRGFVLKSTNTGVLRSCKHWPSSNAAGPTVAPTVTASDIDHGIYLTGDFANDITIQDFDCQPTATYKAGMCAIKLDATTGNAIRVLGGTLEGSGSIVGTGRYALNFANIYFGVFENCYCENADIRISNCRYISLNQIDQAGSGTLLFTGNAQYNTVLGGYYGTVQVDSGSIYNTLINTGIYTGLTDNAVGTRLISVGGAADLIDRGGRPIFVSATRASQTMTAGANTVVVCTTEVIDNAGLYDPTTGKFTPAKAGYFRVTLNGYLVSVADNKEITLLLFKNGSTAARTITGSNTSGTVACACSFEFSSAAGDYWQIAIRNGDASDRTLTEPNITFSAIG